MGRRKRLQDKETKPVPNPAPVTSRKPNPKAWRKAMELADGDPRRITVNADGSCTVNNKRVR